jgi:hypothetical protein
VPIAPHAAFVIRWDAPPFQKTKQGMRALIKHFVLGAGNVLSIVATALFNS